MGPELVLRDDGSEAAGPASTGELVSLYVGQVCLTEEGSATIKSVEALNPRGGFKVTNYALIRDGNGMLGFAERPLADVRRYQPIPAVSAICQPNTSSPSALAVELVKPTDERAITTGFRINYQVDGKAKTATMAYQFTLCSYKQLDKNDC